MISIAGRYISITFLKYVLIAALAVYGVIYIVELSEAIRRFSDVYSWWKLVGLAFLNSHNYLDIALLISLFIGGYAAYRKLESNQDLTSLAVAGISTVGYLTPAWVTAAVIGLATIFTLPQLQNAGSQAYFELTQDRTETAQDISMQEFEVWLKVGDGPQGTIMRAEGDKDLTRLRNIDIYFNTPLLNSDIAGSGDAGSDSLIDTDTQAAIIYAKAKTGLLKDGQWQLENLELRDIAGRWTKRPSLVLGKNVDETSLFQRRSDEYIGFLELARAKLQAPQSSQPHDYRLYALLGFPFLAGASAMLGGLAGTGSTRNKKTPRMLYIAGIAIVLLVVSRTLQELSKNSLTDTLLIGLGGSIVITAIAFAVALACSEI